jgi:hypothetical protein
MDPLASVKEFRQQATGAARTLTVAPPPPIPVATPAVAPAGPVVDDLDPTGELDLTGLSAEAPTTGPDPAERAGANGEADDLPGMPRGRKRLINAYLPGATRHRLETARADHGTLGAAVMAALRGSYRWLVDQHTPEPVEAVGPFPAPRPPRRRLAVEDARLRPFYVHPDEAKAIDQLADELELSVSELVTLAVDHFFGDDA